MNFFEFFDTAVNCATDRHISFHMPGHKGRPTGALFDSALPFDLTELPCTDNLLSPEKGGALEKTYARIRKIYQTQSTIFSAGGATAALQASISAVMRSRGKKVLCDRSVHMSVIYTLSHCDAQPVWLLRDKGGNLDPAAVIHAIKAHQDTACIIITSPDYYGRICDISAIASEAKKYNIPVIVDSAHGAHLPFFQDGALSAYKNGASFVIESLHKTLPALTGAALLHSDGTLHEKMLITAMIHFASSSPSYLVSLSICQAIAFMHTKGGALLDTLLSDIDIAKKKLATSGFSFINPPIADPFRLCVKPPAGRSPRDLYHYLYKHGIICEFYDTDTVVLIPSVMNTTSDFDILCALCADFAKTPAGENPYSPPQLPAINPKAALTMTEALLAKAPRLFHLSEAKGRICAEPQAPYPPGTAVIVPGEIYDNCVIDYLSDCGFDEVWVIE
ncbi:MAG: aminotransferase class I/II-fold pyridoxal phosphate-dependent enzyme [Clostridiales bacterium]|nr:aminotransferase class I/II-fold pyridoxal phosphate-dependent enzyme [Clostridiales bacterium]